MGLDEPEGLEGFAELRPGKDVVVVEREGREGCLGVAGAVRVGFWMGGEVKRVEGDGSGEWVSVLFFLFF